MDILAILAAGLSFPSYRSNVVPEAGRPVASMVWDSFSEGLYEIGADGKDFFIYDNEKPKHKTYLQDFSIADRLIRNGAYLRFIEDGGYQNPKLWLSKGWDWVQKNDVRTPLYWLQQADVWFQYSLLGLHEMELSHPVSHLSYFEADAFARWYGARLPTEAELECSLYQDEERSVEPRVMATDCYDLKNSLWCWTQSHYSPYPGFKSFEGLVSEYNGKFMCGQFVLRGGCFATPRGHNRDTYRNFYEPDQRWMFSGLRLAKDTQ